MKSHIISAIAAVAAFAPSLLSAETLLVGDQVTVRESSLARPERGLSMSAVEGRFGAPQNRRAAVGLPPITRWDYAGFSVFFEHERVIHSVITAP